MEVAHSLLICSFTRSSTPLSQDSLGRTPFILAVQRQAYDVALRLAREAEGFVLTGQAGESTTLLTMLCGPTSSTMATDSTVETTLSPLHALYTGRQCTYTRSGTTNLGQRVLLCQTCELTGTYCICHACAEHCHADHVLVEGHFASSAYCDCQEKGCCYKLPLVGKSAARRSLGQLLMSDPAIAGRQNAAGETPLMTLSFEVSGIPQERGFQKD